MMRKILMVDKVRNFQIYGETILHFWVEILFSND